MAAAEDSAVAAQLPGALHAFDPALVAFARTLMNECRNDYPRGTIFWNETAAQFVAALVARHMTGAKLDAGDVIDAAILKRLRDYVMAHLDEPIDVQSMAKLCARSQFHFSRAFSRSVGVGPYHYVAHLRVERAVELIRARRSSLADIAQRVRLR